MKIRWKTARWKTAQLTAGWLVGTPANAVSSPSMAQSSIYMVFLRAVELDRSLLDPPPLYPDMRVRSGPPFARELLLKLPKFYFSIHNDSA